MYLHSVVASCKYQYCLLPGKTGLENDYCVPSGMLNCARSPIHFFDGVIQMFDKK